MIKKQSAEEQIATMQHLINFGVNENSAKSSQPIVEFKKKAANGKTYGIIRESTKFYIMEAPQKDTEILAEDFDYIGGFNNRKENEYSSYSKASNALDLKIMSINETVEKSKRVNIEKPVVKSEWEDRITESMRKEIDRFKDITKNVASILKEDKGVGTVPSEHTLPEAPAKNPSDDKVNTPFTDTAVANGDKDFKKQSTDHEKVGKPFNTDGEATSTDMTSDKKPVIKGEETYGEDAQYVPNNSVADKKPSGGKVVRVSENKGRKIRLKLTEEQILTWNDNKNYMDKSQGTKIGSSAPYSDEVGSESNQTEAPTESIHESESLIYDDADNQNSPTPGISEVGDTAPFDKKVNEDVVTADDAAGMPDEEEDFSDYPFPEVMEDNYDDDELGLDFEPENEDEYELELGDDTDEDYTQFESVRRVNEDRLNDFGAHPAYRKHPMTTPPNKEVAINGAREWDDESVQGEEPYGEKIGSSAPFDEIVDAMTESIYRALYSSKKKV